MLMLKLPSFAQGLCTSFAEGMLQPAKAPAGAALLPVLREAVRELPDVHLPARQAALHVQRRRAALRARQVPRHEQRLPLLRAGLPLEETAGNHLVEAVKATTMKNLRSIPRNAEHQYQSD